MTHSALQVANEFIKIGEKNNTLFTPMQLLKLVYIAHGWMLALYNKPLIAEQVEAWKYGPVIADLYHAVKHFRSMPVTKQIQVEVEADFDVEEEAVIDYVYRAYGHVDGISLSQITHAEGTPWSVTYHDACWNGVISNNVIGNHYKQLLDGLKKRASNKNLV